MTMAVDFSFGTKAETLDRLQGKLSQSNIPDLLYFEIQEWTSNSHEVISKIATRFEGQKVAVRSSAQGEDAAEQAMAGQFDSVLNIPADSAKEILGAVDEVIESYVAHGKVLDQRDHILIQKMLTDVEVSGVLFTQDIKTGAPYFVINYDDITGRTDTVTAGGEYSNRTLYVHRGAIEAVKSERFHNLISAASEIEKVINSTALDIEFGIDSGSCIHILQVRRITTEPNWNRSITVRIDDAVKQIQNFVAKRFLPMSAVLGKRSVFGQMPDWNPAEMIGRAPRPLAMSLYRHLITDEAWRVARAKMNYAEPVGLPLMVSLGGQPYIDVRLSFHSLLPANLLPEIGEKLVNTWLNHLARSPQLHDKIEFEVAITGYALDFDANAQSLLGGALNDAELSEFKEALRNLTNELLVGNVTPISEELGKIESLAHRRRKFQKNNGNVDVATVASLLEDCRNLGTIPFSVLARHAFIARSLLHSLVSTGLLMPEEADSFFRSIRTIASEFSADSRLLAEAKLSRDLFFGKYGHLRPGTYDILSLRYDQRDDLFDENKSLKPTEDHSGFNLKSNRTSAIDNALAAHQLDLTCDQLFEYIRKATAAREYAKFIFSHNISDALEAITIWGQQNGLSRDELSYLKIDDILETLVIVNEQDMERQLRDLSDAGRLSHETAQALRLPQVLFDIEGVHVVPFQISEPNFVTSKAVTGRTVHLGQHEIVSKNLSNAIVMIENADPGFDWIFSHDILGLVTKYGGVNSHMAIRCAEFGIAAAIGCGEQIFERLKLSSSVELNCAENHIRPSED
ncbi:MAG: pyruvate phosphate dikinase [Rhodospirillales bacterium]|jgi:glutamine kinase|nr:pyruvate phosphate dikinase [Rhodospirillales bacterium]